MLAVALIYVAVFFAVGAVATRSPKQSGPAKKHHGLELLDVSVGYGSTTILSIGSLFLSPGTAAGLIAPNGSGKTTFLEALSGQFPTRIHSGSLVADGIQPTSISRICRTRLPELFRRHGSLPHAISSSTLLSLGRRGNRPPTSTRSAAPSESPHISTSRPVNSRQE